MWIILLIVCTSPAWAQRVQRQDEHDHGPGSAWDIRLAVPGEPGTDYPTLDGIPKTSFSCAGKTPGYYADTEADCQVFRICTIGSTYGFQSFLCPNGTLFNQAVFVCDWWMNVNCGNTQQIINNNNNAQFGNLRMGPQLMSDVKKMITHPMRNPFDRNAMKGNLITMQQYIPPSGQLQLAPKRPDTSFLPPKFSPINEVKDNLIAGSTPGPLYAPAQTDSEIFQRQRQQQQRFQQSAKIIQQNGYQYNNGQYQQNNNAAKYQQNNNAAKYQQQQPNRQHIQNNQFVQSSRLQEPSRQYHQNNKQNGHQAQSGRLQNGQQNGNYNTYIAPNIPTANNIVANGQAGRLMQHKDAEVIQQHNTFLPQAPAQQAYTNPQYNQQTINSQRQTQYSNNVIPTQQSHTRQQTEFGVSFTRQNVEQNKNQAQQLYQPPVQFSSQIKGQVGTEAKQNLVSPNKPNGFAKTLSFSRIVQNPKPGSPKSRITFKTWIVKPSKTARLIATPTPYAYEKPTNPPAAKLIAQPTPYQYDRPTTNAQTAKLVSESGYTYNRPTIPTQTEKIVQQGYVYEKPTVAAKQVEIVRQTPRPFVTSPTVTTIPVRLYETPTLPPSPPPPPPRLYLPPTTYKPAAKLYIPPSEKTIQITQQYLPANFDDDGQSAKLQASPTSPTPVFASPPKDKSLFSLIKHSRINTNHNNLTFTDILTKEKLDITVNDIIKDTSKVLVTASPPQLEQIRQGNEDVDYREQTYLPPESEENLTPSPTTAPTANIKSSRLIAPSNDLEPPHESVQTQHSSNRLSDLPFLKDPGPTNTIERTVSLKITIPEKTAAYLFKTCNDSDFDRLEILNTGSSNYLVLTNKIAKQTSPSFIPIGKLVVDKDSNLSDSQALVFSFLADSINQAKGYNTIAEQNIQSTSSGVSQYQNANNAEISQISNQVAQLTAAQYNTNSGHNNNANAKLIQTTQSTSTGYQYENSAKYTNDAQQINEPQINTLPLEQNGHYHSSRFQSGTNNKANLQSNQIYSGQLYQSPVPDVSSIYNEQSSPQLISSNDAQHTELADLQQSHNHNGPETNNNSQQNSAEVEIVQSQSLPPAADAPAAAPAKLQAAPESEQQSFNSEENTASTLGNFVNGANGISAQLHDKIVGTITHPSENNKLVTYKKDQSYFVFTKLDHLNGLDHPRPDAEQGSNGQQQSAKLTQSSNGDNVVYQFIPSVGYQLEDEKEQQNLLNQFHINEFGSPKGGNNGGSGNVLSSNVDYSVQHGAGQSQQVNAPNTLYAGPSSYSAPQASVGRLESNTPAKLEQFNPSNNGYSKVTPSRSFNFK